MDKEILSTRQAAEILGKSPSAVRNLVMRRKIPHRKPRGAGLYFLRSELEAWISEAPGIRLEDLKDDECD